MTVMPPPGSQTPSPPVNIVRAVAIDSALIAVGVALYLSTGQIFWAIGGFIASSAVLFTMIVAPLWRARADARRQASDGGPRIVE